MPRMNSLAVTIPSANTLIAYNRPIASFELHDTLTAKSTKYPLETVTSVYA